MSEEVFDEVQGHIRDAVRRLIDAMEPDNDGKNSVWHTLYSYETEQVIYKLKEAMMWLTEARMSVG